MKKIKKILYPVCAVILLVAVWNLWQIRTSTKHTAQLYQKLSEFSSQELRKETTDQTTETELPEKKVENPWLEDLQKQNTELVGWIRIPGTAINYPVMQTTEDNDYYLTHDFEKNKNVHGTPFLDVNCKIGQSDNLIIYGHHMKDGTMFQNLMEYEDADFCETNGIIQFDTPEESAQYQVIFVMLISVEEAGKFPYYKCIDLSDEHIYEGFLIQCSRYAIWQSQELPDPGTKLLTLSTCEYSKKNGRLVVVAKQV